MHPEVSKLIYQFIAEALIVGSLLGYFLYSMARLHQHYLRQAELFNRVKIAAHDEERRVIAADLHDDFGQMVTGTMHLLQGMNPRNEEEQSVLNKSIGALDDLYKRVTHLSNTLVPKFLDSSGPLIALEQFNAQYNRPSTLRVDFYHVDCSELPADKSLHIFRMLQEIQQNAIKHSQATRLSISGYVIDRKFIIDTADDGIGFDTDLIHTSKGQGLKNLELRARMIGARLLTDSIKGKGTSYVIEVPLDS